MTSRRGSGFIQRLDAATLVATKFTNILPAYVDIQCGDGRDQRFQVADDYPVSVIERLGNPSFATTDFWGLSSGGSLTGGNLVITNNCNVTQTGLKTTVVSGIYEVSTDVSSWTSGQITPSTVTGGTGTAITAAGVNVQRITATIASTSFRLASTAGSSLTVASTSFKRVMTHACIVSADGVIWEPVGDINVLAYGVVADGVTDDTAALLNALSISYNLGRKALLPAGRMLVTGQVLDFLGTGAVQIEGDPAASVIINEMSSAGTMFNIAGRTDGVIANTIYLTAAAAQGDRTLTLNDTSQLSVDQDVLLKDWSNPVVDYDQLLVGDLQRLVAISGEVSRIKSIDSATQVTLRAQLEFAMAAQAVLTGTVSTSGTAVTGVGTLFTTELVDNSYFSITGIAAPLKIRKINSNTSLTLGASTTTVSGVAATKLGGVVQRFLDRAEFRLSGVRVEGGSVSVPNTNNIFVLAGVRRYVARDLSFIAAGCNEFTIIKSLRGKLDNYYSEDAGMEGFDAYCIKLANGARGLQINHAYAQRPRHLVTTVSDENELEVMFVYHTGCYVDQPMLAGFDQHPGARNFFYTGCGVSASDYDVNPTAAFNLRGRHITVSNCQAVGTHIGLNCAFGDHNYINGFLASGCDISLNVSQSHHLDIRGLVSLNALTNDVLIDSHDNTGPALALSDIRIQGRGEGDPSDASVSAAQWSDDWRIDFRNSDATTKYDSGVPSSHSHGIIAKSADFDVIANLTCIYRTTGTTVATLPTLASDTGEATYTFTEVSGALTIDGNGAETIDGGASITPTGTVQVKKDGETGAWVSW